MRTRAGLLALSLAACGGPGPSSAAPPPSPGDAGLAPPTIDGGARSASGADGAAPTAPDAAGATHGPYPAFRPVMPVLQSAGGPVLSAPRPVAITFPGDADADSLEDFVARVGATDYWARVTSQYGIGAATALPPVRLASPAPATTTVDDIAAWLAASIDAQPPTLPAFDGNTVYVLFYPSTTSITSDGYATCTDFLGGHNQGTLADGRPFPFIIAARCPGASDLASLTRIASHELVEASTDPYPGTAPGYVGIDAAHFAFNVAFLSEAADLCDDYPPFVPPDLPYSVQRTWSNASASAWHDPCGPESAHEVYFNAAPVLPDTVTLYGGEITTPAVVVPLGQSRTIEVDLWSDAPTSGPWQIAAVDAPTRMGAPAELAFVFDRSQGLNGDKLELTIRRVAAASQEGATAFVLQNTLGAQTTEWAAFAGQ